MGERMRALVAGAMVAIGAIVPDTMVDATAPPPSSELPQATAPTADDLSDASLTGSYLLQVLVTESVNSFEQVGQVFTIPVPLIVNADGSATFLGPDMQFDHSGTSVMTSSSAVTDCIDEDSNTTVPDGYNSVVTFDLAISDAVLVDGQWEVTELTGSGAFDSTPVTGSPCPVAHESLVVTGFRTDVPQPEPDQLAAPPGALSGSADAAALTGGATATLQLVIDPAVADPFEPRSVRAAITVTGSWFTFDAASPIPGATLTPGTPGAPGLVCGTGGPVDMTTPPPNLSLIFADIGQYSDATQVPAALGDAAQQSAIPRETSQPLFQVALVSDGQNESSATVAGCTTTITYSYAGSFTLLDDNREGRYHVVPTGVVIPYLTAEGASVTLPLVTSNLPIVEVSNSAAPTTSAVAVFELPASVAPTTVSPVEVAAPVAVPATSAAPASTEIAADAGGDGGAGTGLLVIVGVAAVVVIAGGVALARSRVRGRRAQRDPDDRDPRRSDQPQVRSVCDRGTQRVSSSGRGTRLGVRVVEAKPRTTSITSRAGGGDVDH